MKTTTAATIAADSDFIARLTEIRHDIHRHPAVISTNQSAGSMHNYRVSTIGEKHCEVVSLFLLNLEDIHPGYLGTIWVWSHCDTIFGHETSIHSDFDWSACCP